MAVEHWLYCIGFFDLFALSIVNPLINVYFNKVGYSPSFIGLYSSVYGLVQLFSSPYIGHWADKHGKIEIFLICLICSGFGYGFSALVLDFVYFVGLTRIYLGFFKHTQNMCRNILAENVNVSKRTKSIGQLNAISAMGVVLGSIVSGILSELIGLKNAISVGYLCCLFVFMLNSIIVYMFIKPYADRNNDYVSTFADIDSTDVAYSNSQVGSKSSDSTNFSSNIPSVSSSLNRKNSFFTQVKEIDWETHGGLFVTQFLLAFAVMIYRSSFILGMKHFYPQLTPVEFGYLLSYNSFIGFAFGYTCSFVFAHSSYINNEEKLLLHAILFILAGMLILATSYNIYLLLTGLAVLVIGTVASKASGVSIAMKRCTPGEIGKLSGLNYSLVSLARFIAPVITGFIQEYSYAAPAYVSFFISLVALIIFYFKVYLYPIKCCTKID